MAPISHDDSGLSEYEKQRNRNIAENRKILESIRQEQLYSLQELMPKKIKVVKPSAAAADGEEKPKPKKKRKVEPILEGGLAESDSSYRRSGRLSGKAPEFSVKHGDDSGEEDDTEDEDYRKRKTPAGSRPRVVIEKNRPNVYGPIDGIEVGHIWETRMECSADGVHRPPVAGIHGGLEGAFSLALSGGYEDDVDLGDCFTYTGEGGRALNGTKAKPKNLRTAPQSKDQTLTKGNLALSLNVSSRQPVRVIRGYKLPTEFAPEFGYRYDGMYSVEKYWACIGQAGFKVYKFALRRCPDQAPPPWLIVNNADGSEEKKEDDSPEEHSIPKQVESNADTAEVSTDGNVLQDNSNKDDNQVSSEQAAIDEENGQCEAKQQELQETAVVEKYEEMTEMTESQDVKSHSVSKGTENESTRVVQDLTSNEEVEP